MPILFFLFFLFPFSSHSAVEFIPLNSLRFMKNDGSVFYIPPHTGSGYSCPTSISVSGCTDIGGMRWEPGCVADWNKCWRIDNSTGQISSFTAGNIPVDSAMCMDANPGNGFSNCGFAITIQ